MKVITIRLEDGMSELVSLVAELEGTNQTDWIRQAIAAHLERKVAGGDLTARAQAVLDEVEREAQAKRQAIEQLVGNVADAVRSKGPSRSAGTRRGSSKAAEDDEPSGPEARVIPIGFAPPGRP